MIYITSLFISLIVVVYLYQWACAHALHLTELVDPVQFKVVNSLVEVKGVTHLLDNVWVVSWSDDEVDYQLLNENEQHEDYSTVRKYLVEVNSIVHLELSDMVKPEVDLANEGNIQILVLWHLMVRLALEFIVAVVGIGVSLMTVVIFGVVLQLLVQAPFVDWQGETSGVTGLQDFQVHHCLVNKSITFSDAWLLRILDEDGLMCDFLCFFKYTFDVGVWFLEFVFFLAFEQDGVIIKVEPDLELLWNLKGYQFVFTLTFIREQALNGIPLWQAHVSLDLVVVRMVVHT
jgi:hypothetical protein